MRRRKWLRRGAYFLVFLLVLGIAGYAAFWWLLFNPLESDVEYLAALVPKEVSYVVHSQWGKLRTSDFYRANVLESPIRGEVESSLELEEYLYRPLKQIEEQVNDSAPDFFGEFSILDDVMGREILLAGRMNGGGETLEDKILNAPFVVLTRISTKAKFMEVLRFGFVREKIPNLEVYRDFFKYDVGEKNIRPGAPEEARYFYFSRIRDVLVLSNDRELMQKVTHFGLAGGDVQQSDESLPRFWWFYYDMNDKGELPADAGSTVWFRLAQADRELRGELEGIGKPSEGGPSDYLKALFPVAFTNTITLHLGTEGERVAPISGSIRMIKDANYPKHISGFHTLAGRDIGTAIDQCAAMAPLDRAMALVHLEMAPEDLLLTLFTGLDRTTQELFFGTDGQPGTQRWSMADMAKDVGVWFEEGVDIVVSRLPEVDGIDLDSFDGGLPEPVPATTLVLTEKAQLEPRDLIDYFIRNHERFGLGRPEEIPVENGRLFRMTWSKDLSMKLLDTGFAVLGRKVLLGTNVGELQRMLETAGGKGSALSSGEEFKAARKMTHSKGKFFLFADGGRLRPYLRDLRWQAAYDETNYSEAEFRKQNFIEMTKLHRDWDNTRVNQEVGRLLEERARRRAEVEFPRAIQDYLYDLYWADPFAWFALSADIAGDSAGTYFELMGGIGFSGGAGR